MSRLMAAPNGGLLKKTFSTVENLMYAEGFVMLDIDGPQYRVPSHNSRLTSTIE